MQPKRTTFIPNIEPLPTLAGVPVPCEPPAELALGIALDTGPLVTAFARTLLLGLKVLLGLALLLSLALLLTLALLVILALE